MEFYQPINMSKYYAIAVGRTPGIYRSWAEAKPMIDGFKGAKYKSFKTLAEAQNFMTNPQYGNNTKVGNNTNTKVGNNRINRIKKVGTRVTAQRKAQQQQPVRTFNEITFYTDGSSINNIGGYGFVLATGNDATDLHFSGRVPYNPATNQIAELYAIYVCLYWSISQGHKNITIYTDSKYSIGCLTIWYHNWIKNGWVNSKGEPVANKELIHGILSLYGQITPTFHHVRAHKGDKYNEIADRLANEGRQNRSFT